MSDTNENLGPWADDLRGALGEEYAGAFDAVDGYLRSNWQPRVTELEQGTAEARELWNDVTTDFDSTLVNLFASAYGEEHPELVEKFTESYNSLFSEGETEEDAPPAEGGLDLDKLPPEVRQTVEWAQAKRDAELRAEQASEYSQAKRELLEQHKDALTEDDLDLLDPFVAGTGTLEDAVTQYQAFLEKFASRHGFTRADGEPAPEPPPVLGSEGGTAAVPPAEKKYTKYNEIGDALGDYLARQRTATPPPMAG